jgi:hypothetical protein
MWDKELVAQLRDEAAQDSAVKLDAGVGLYRKKPRSLGTGFFRFLFVF